jgi:CheY-like chemotaxis protein
MEVEGSDGMSQRILVVDDEPQIRSMLREWLTRVGFEVSEASDGKEAIETLRKELFDVVIADILMPEKDGLEVIMYLQRERPLTKCVAISAPSNRVFLQSAQLLGATRVVEKPFTPADIEAAVRDALASSS